MALVLFFCTFVLLSEFATDVLSEDMFTEEKLIQVPASVHRQYIPMHALLWACRVSSTCEGDVMDAQTRSSPPPTLQASLPQPYRLLNAHSRSRRLPAGRMEQVEAPTMPELVDMLAHGVEVLPVAQEPPEPVYKVADVDEVRDHNVGHCQAPHVREPCPFSPAPHIGEPCPFSPAPYIGEP